MNKQVKFCILVFASVALFSNCIGGRVTKEISLQPAATIIRSENYEILGKGEGTTSCFYLLGFIRVTSPPNIQYAMSKAVDQVEGGISLIDMTISQEWHYYFPLGRVAVIRVKGSVIGKKSGK